MDQVMCSFETPFPFPLVDVVNVTRGSCNRFESLGMIADTRDASCWKLIYMETLELDILLMIG